MGVRRVSLLLTVAVFGVIALGNPVENLHNNDETETEGEILEDILGKWLKDFGTYTYMVDQDADEGEDEGVTGAAPEVTSVVPENGDEDEDEDDEDEDYKQSSSAPISISIDKATTLLNPELDYTVKLESLVAEGGSVLVTLASFQNKTSCGVGGFTLQPEDRERGGQEGRLNITHQQEGNRSTTIVAFAVDNEPESPTTRQSGDEGSAWEELSQNLWWAKGKLAGGGLLTLTFTPPECDCLMLKAHYAFSIGDNLTLAVGPETYPKDLEMLICVDPSIINTQENLLDAEVDEGSITAETLEGVAAAQGVDEDDDEPRSTPKVGKGRGKWAAKKLKRERKRRRQEARQAIRQAGKKVTRKRVIKHMRLQRRHDDSEENVESRQGNHRAGRQGGGGGGGGGKWARKQARKAARKHAKQAKKAWKKQRRNSRKNKHNRRNRIHKNLNATEDAAEFTENPFSTTLAPTDEDAAADILLSDDAEVDEDEENNDSAGGAAAGEGPNRRRGRKQGRQRGKPRNRSQNKEQRKGIKFCCKRGIKFKKSHFSDSTDEKVLPDVSCSDTNDIISTFAEHQFGIDKAQCAARFETCCSKFSPQLWENVKSKKAAKKAKRKEQRKARQQKRRQERQQTSTTAAD